MTVHGINVTSYLRWCLTGVLILLCYSIIYTGFFKPDFTIHPMFDANQFPTGPWASEMEYLVFSYHPNIIMEILKDETDSSQYLHVHLPAGDVYKGFGISQFLDIPIESTLNLKWKYSGNTTGIQVDIKDNENINQNDGEVFSHIILPPKDQWTFTSIPLNDFVRNEYQSQNNPKDGILNTNPIQSVEFALPPQEVVDIYVKNIYFTSYSPKWLLITGMVLIGAIGLILFIRTSREFFSVMPDEQAFSDAVSFRLMYIFMSTAFVYASLFDTVKHDWFVPGCVYLIFYSLICLNLFEPNRSLKRVFGIYSFLALFAASWWFGYPKSSAELLLILITVSIPFIQRKYSVILFLLIITFIVFLPVIFQYPFPFEWQHVVYIYLFYICLIIFSLGIQQNLITKIKEENTSTMYEELFNHTSDAIFSFYANGMIENVNKGFESLIGKPRNELIGTFIQDWVLMEDLPLLPMHQSKQNDALRKYDMRFINYNHEVLYTNIIERTKKINGEISSYQVIARDMTKWKQVEHLEKEKELAEQSSAFKTLFLSNMTHEIRTPLHGIIGAIDILSTTELKEDQEQFLNIAKSSSKKLLDLVNEILDFATIESGKLELKHDVFSINQIINDVTKSILNKAEAKQLKMQVISPTIEHEYYMGDSFRIRQILMNLLDNAVKFTEKGSITLQMVVVKDMDESTRFRFLIIDTGIGIAEENLDAVFEVFTQVDSSYTRLYGGTGLGLAVCKELVHIMKGEIGVESERELGSTFWFEISLQKEQSESVSLFK